MSTGPRSQCDTCARFRSRWSMPRGQRPDGPFCAAFPDGIPKVVFQNGRDHRYPIEGDHGLQWQSDGEEFPEWAFLPQFLGERRLIQVPLVAMDPPVGLHGISGATSAAEPRDGAGA